MPVIVVTRLRPTNVALLDEFFTDAVAAIEQAQKSDRNLGADALADANNAWWSVTAWQDRRLMQGYVDSEPHLDISKRLDHYCDEATFVDWEQASADLPDWQTSWRHLTADGKAAQLTHPSAANQTRDFPRRSSHLPVSAEAASAKPRTDRPRPPEAPAACCVATGYPERTGSSRVARSLHLTCRNLRAAFLQGHQSASGLASERSPQVLAYGIGHVTHRPGGAVSDWQLAGRAARAR